MWVEKTPYGFRAVERYKDPLTNKQKKVYVSMEKNTSSTRKAAEKVLLQKIADATHRTSHDDIRLGELINMWLEGSSPHIKKSTYETQRYVKKTLLNVFPEDIIVSNIRAQYVRNTLSSVNNVTTRNNILKRLKQVCRWGYSNELVGNIEWTNKVVAEKDTAKKKRTSDKFLESFDLDSILCNMKNQKLRDLTEFLSLTGMRIGEALALEFTDIDLKNRIISITKTRDDRTDIITPPKTSASIREIYIQDELLDLCTKLTKYASGHRFISPYLFEGCKYHRRA